MKLKSMSHMTCKKLLTKNSSPLLEELILRWNFCNMETTSKCKTYALRLNLWRRPNSLLSRYTYTTTLKEKGGEHEIKMQKGKWVDAPDRNSGYNSSCDYTTHQYKHQNTLILTLFYLLRTTCRFGSGWSAEKKGISLYNNC